MSKIRETHNAIIAFAIDKQGQRAVDAAHHPALEVVLDALGIGLVIDLAHEAIAIQTQLLGIDDQRFRRQRAT